MSCLLFSSSLGSFVFIIIIIIIIIVGLDFDVAVNTLLPAGAAAVRTESDGGNQVTFLRLVRFRTFESLSSGEGGPGFDGEAGSAFYTSSVPLQEMAGFKSISTMKIQDFQGCADGS